MTALHITDIGPRASDCIGAAFMCANAKNMDRRILVDRMTEADLPLVKLLLSELIDALEGSKGFNIEVATENCRAMLKLPSYGLLVARDLGNVAGFVNFTVRRTALHPGLSGLIDELIVSRGSRGRGIGRILIQAVINECRRLGCCEVEVSTEKSNLSARRFYQACGFEEAAVLLELGIG